MGTPRKLGWMQHLAGFKAAPAHADAHAVKNLVQRIQARSQGLHLHCLAGGDLTKLRLVVPQKVGWAARKTGHRAYLQCICSYSLGSIRAS